MPDLGGCSRMIPESASIDDRLIELAIDITANLGSLTLAPEIRARVLKAAEQVKAERRAARPCPDCGGKGAWVDYTIGSHMPDPQTEVTCDRCEGEGVDWK